MEKRTLKEQEKQMHLDLSKRKLKEDYLFDILIEEQKEKDESIKRLIKIMDEINDKVFSQSKK